MFKLFVRVSLLGLVVSLSAMAQTADSVNRQIIDEEAKSSAIMSLLHRISDVYGPRLTGSPNLKAADDWAVVTLRSWGISNAHLEPWTFQPASASAPVPGWENMELSADAISPFRGPLVVQPSAWTPGTKGIITADAIMLTPPGLMEKDSDDIAAGAGQINDPAAGPPPPMPAHAASKVPEQPTREMLDAYLDPWKDIVRGKIVLVGKPSVVPVNFLPTSLRHPDQYWQAQFGSINPYIRSGEPRPNRSLETTLPHTRMTVSEVMHAVDQFLVENGALVRINDSRRAYGVVVAQHNHTYDLARTVPTLAMRNEDYGRISRILSDGTAVKLRINVQNKIYPEGVTAYNVIGEITGSDKADEIVMLGAHLDSWHVATGAADNGIGCAMMMEAMRLLATLKIKPRRTIRLALWSGEEQGVLGSQAYVKRHFGTAENPQPGFAKLDAYLNIDSGTGKPRGATIFGPARAATIVSNAFLPFMDQGFAGVRVTNSRSVGNSDYGSFNNAGLPGINFSQDPFDYQQNVHHTNLDNYERIDEQDARQGAIEITAAIYALAMADEMLPRLTPAEMHDPLPVPAPGSTAVPLAVSKPPVMLRAIKQ